MLIWVVGNCIGGFEILSTEMLEKKGDVVWQLNILFTEGHFT